MKLLLTLSAILLAACGSEPPKRAAAPQSAPVPVQTASVAAREWPAVYTATGTVRARTTTVIAAKVMAYVQQVSVSAGDRVRQGQTLITLEARDLESGLHRAQAGRAELDSAVPEIEHAAAAAQANLELADATFRRIQELSAKNSVSRQEFDEASARVQSARANYEAIRARRAQITSRMAVADEEVRAASVLRDYSRLAAPFNGIVTARSVEPGSMAVPGAPLLTIEQDGAYRLEASVDESQLASIRTGQSVPVTIDAENRTLAGRVAEIVPVADSASRTYLVKLDLPASPGLRSGMFGRAQFPLSPQQVSTIPAAALVQRGQLQSVFVIESGVARTRLVTTGRRERESLEVLSGLNPGETVVCPVPSALADAARIEVRQ